MNCLASSFSIEGGARPRLKVLHDKVNRETALPLVDLRREGQAAGAAGGHQFVHPVAHAESDRLEGRATLTHPKTEVSFALADLARLPVNAKIAVEENRG